MILAVIFQAINLENILSTAVSFNASNIKQNRLFV